jgi:hypothetical protein
MANFLYYCTLYLSASVLAGTLFATSLAYLNGRYGETPNEGDDSAMPRLGFVVGVFSCVVMMCLTKVSDVTAFCVGAFVVPVLIGVAVLLFLIIPPLVSRIMIRCVSLNRFLRELGQRQRAASHVTLEELEALRARFQSAVCAPETDRFVLMQYVVDAAAKKGVGVSQLLNSPCGAHGVEVAVPAVVNDGQVLVTPISPL